MRLPTFPMRALLIVSALALASSCSDKPAPLVSLSLPADTFERDDRPPMTVEALTSEAALEKVEDARDSWAKATARKLDAACRLIRDSAVPSLVCRDAKAEWE